MKCALERPSVERCVLCAEIRAEIAVKIYRVLEKQWAHGCRHIGFLKSCYGGKHANVSDVMEVSSVSPRVPPPGNLGRG